MEKLSVYGTSLMPHAAPIAVHHKQACPSKTVRQSQNIHEKPQKQTRIVITRAGKSGGFSLNSIFKRCENCGGKGAIECQGCKGTGKNKKNGNIFERWKCFDCQGFGLKSCPSCGQGGLTPEQRGER